MPAEMPFSSCWPKLEYPNTPSILDLLCHKLNLYCNAEPNVNNKLEMHIVYIDRGRV